MKSLIIISISLLFILSSCKKDDLNSDKLKVEINTFQTENLNTSSFRTGENTVDIVNLNTKKSILSSKTSYKTIFETESVLPGDNIDITYILNCNCDITIKYKGKLLARGLRNFLGGKEAKISVAIPR
ncbi:hypothetical protein H7F33_11910 [Pedobacter sp. PAMC26386]|nr:hypothetical protein H7F33_11910 [Pedobacter sp. PAMC26386]